jgi:hypothetical protein
MDARRRMMHTITSQMASWAERKAACRIGDTAANVGAVTNGEEWRTSPNQAHVQVLRDFQRGQIATRDDYVD